MNELKLNKLISIIIPVYNAEKYIDKCLDTLIHQTYTNLQIIIVDDGSKDDSLNICKKIASSDHRIEIYSKENGGVSQARNDGIRYAKGEYIAFIDADDWVSLDYIEKLYTNINKTNSDITFCKYGIMQEDKLFYFEPDYPESIISGTQEFDSFLIRFFDKKHYFMGSSCRSLIKKSIIENISFNENLYMYEDLIFIFKCLMKSNKVSFINDILYFYRDNATSILHSKKSNFLNHQLEVYKEIKNIQSAITNDALNKMFNIWIGNNICYESIVYKIKTNKRHLSLKDIKKEEFYRYFKLKNFKYLDNFKFKIRYIVIWFFTKVYLF